MTPQEAILQLKTDKLCLMAIASHPSLINVDEINVAISALEKQIPKKVKDKYRDIISIGKCPVCERQCDTTMNYCMKCGQALDWGD